MTIDDLPLHPDLNLAPAGCYLPASVPVPDVAMLATTAARLQHRFPTPFPATPGEVEMVAAGLVMGCTSRRWRAAYFWQWPVPERAYDFRQMAEYMVTPDAFESARDRGWSPAWAREIHFQMPEPTERLDPVPATKPNVPYEPGERTSDWLKRVAAQRMSEDLPIRREPAEPGPRYWIGILRTGVRLFDVDAIEYDEVDGDFPDDTLDTREDW